MGRHDRKHQHRIRHRRTVVGCGASALSDLRWAQVCRHDKTRLRRIRQRRTAVGCGASALSDLPFGRRFVGMIRRASVASGNDARLSDAARAPYPTYGGRRLVGMIRRVSVASGNTLLFHRLADLIQRRRIIDGRQIPRIASFANRLDRAAQHFSGSRFR